MQTTNVQLYERQERLIGTIERGYSSNSSNRDSIVTPRLFAAEQVPVKMQLQMASQDKKKERNWGRTHSTTEKALQNGWHH